MSKLKAVASLCLFIILAACTPAPAPKSVEPTADVTATFARLQTDVAATDAAAAPPSAAAPTAVPAPTSEPPTAAPPASGDEEGREAILILEPGITSNVTSPVRVAGLADPAFEQTVIVQVSDESGETVGALATQIQADVSQRGPFEVEVPFTVSADQAGRILVFTISPRDGGLTHLASVEVTLLASGAATINPAERHKESIAIFEPQLLASISGGTLHLSGFSDYVFENVLNVALCGAGGGGVSDLLCGTADNLLATGTVNVNSPDIGQPGPFEGDLSYTVAGGIPARLVVYNTSPRDGGITHLSAVDVQLAP